MNALATKTVLARLLPIAASAALHVSVFASVMGGHASQSPLPSTPTAQVDLVEVQVEDEPPTAPIAAGRPNEVAASHRHPYPVPAGHDAQPHDPSLAHGSITTAASPAEAPAGIVATAPEAPRFTIALGSSAQTSRVVASGAQGAGDPDSSDSIVPESAVSTAARIQSVAPATYPPGARADEVEADVLVEIVVDTSGRVINATPLRHAGYGFDQSALEAVRKYRFLPAQRNGQAVRVRMRWVVQFRLN